MWLVVQPDGVLLRLQIQPKASTSGVVGLHGDRLKVRISSPPVDGKANDALLEFLSKTLGVPHKSLTLVRGDKSKMKDVYCQGMTGAQVATLFGVLLK